MATSQSPDRAIVAGRGEDLAIGGKRQHVDVAFVPGQLADESRGRRVPEANGPIEARGGEQRAIRRIAYAGRTVSGGPG